MHFLLTLLNGYMVVGTVISGANTNIYMLQVDLNLNIVSGYPKMLTSTGKYEIGGFIQLASGEFVIVGSGFNTSNNTDDVLYIKTNAFGTPNLGPKLIGVGGTVSTDKAYGVVESADGKVVIVGYTFNNTSSTLDAFIMKKSADLLQSFADAPIVGANNEIALGVANIDNSEGFMVVGTTAALGVSKPTDALFIKTDINGNGQMPFKTYGSTTLFESAKAVAKTGTGDFITCGYTTTSTGITNLYFMNVDKTGAAINGFPKSISSSFSGKLPKIYESWKAPILP